MKILQVMAGAGHGGAETAFVDMCLALHEAGETIEVATRANEIRVAALQKAGIPVHTMPFGGPIDIVTPYKLKSIIRRFQPAIVQTWMSRAAAKTPRWKKTSGAPEYKVVSRLGGYYKLKYFKNTDFFTTITPDIKRYLEENGIDANLVHHINNFAEVEPVGLPLKRTDFATPEDALLLLALGRLHTSKAFDVLIEAVSGLPGVHLWIAGEGPERAALEAQIRRLGVEHRVKLLGWREDRAALFQACDICVFPSRYEPFGTVFVQAWAQGRPLIASGADGPRQYVRDGEDGLLFPIDDVAALKAAIQKLAGNPFLRERLTKAGMARYQNEFTKEQCVKNYMDLYRGITGTHS